MGFTVVGGFLRFQENLRNENNSVWVFDLSGWHLGLLHLKGYRGSEDFLKMQGGREGPSDNYVMGEGGGVQSKNIKWGRGVLHGISILKIEAKTIKNT